MPRPRFEKLPKEKQERMLETAASEFSAHGYHGASLNHILEAAGISKGAAYYYFDSKADLFATVLNGYFSHILDESGFNIDAMTHENFWEMTGQLWAQNMSHSSEMPYLPGLFKAAQDLSKEDIEEKPLKEVYDISMRTLSAFISKGREVNSIRNDLPHDLLAAMVLGLDRAGDRWLLDNWDTLSKDEIAMFSKLQLDALKRVLEP